MQEVETITLRGRLSQGQSRDFPDRIFVIQRIIAFWTKTFYSLKCKDTDFFTYEQIKALFLQKKMLNKGWGQFNKKDLYCSLLLECFL